MARRQRDDSSTGYPRVSRPRPLHASPDGPWAQRRPATRAPGHGRADAGPSGSGVPRPDVGDPAVAARRVPDRERADHPGVGDGQRRHGGLLRQPGGARRSGGSRGQRGVRHPHGRLRRQAGRRGHPHRGRVGPGRGPVRGRGGAQGQAAEDLRGSPRRDVHGRPPAAAGDHQDRQGLRRAHDAGLRHLARAAWR